MNLENKSDVCQLLVKGYFTKAKETISNTNININHMDENRRTPLILCSFIDDSSWVVSLAQLLLEYGAKINHIDLNKMNVIHYSILFEQVDLLKLLLDSVDFDINEKDCHGNTPLIYAVIVNNGVIIDLLLQYYQKYKISISASNSKGITAFMQACLCGHIDLIEQLETFGIGENTTDANGKSSVAYKENALMKFKINNKINECRRQSRLVRFYDSEAIMKFQKETIHLKSNAEKLPDVIDDNQEWVSQLQTSLKRLKRNKIDLYYVSRMLENSINATGHIMMNDNFRIRQIRPKTAFMTSKTLRSRNDWYSLLGPLYISLEQKYSSSFKNATKIDSQTLESTNNINEKSKGRQRRLSKSMGTYSRRNSITSRPALNDDGSESIFSASKSKKKFDSISSLKALSRNLETIKLNQ